MATPKQVRDKANPILADFWTKLVTVQEKYKAKYGHYFDLQISPSGFVLDGTDSDFEIIPAPLEKHLNDLAIGYSGRVPFQIKVSTNTKTDGTHWFVATAIIKVNGDEYFIRKDSIGETDSNGWLLKQ